MTCEGLLQLSGEHFPDLNCFIVAAADEPFAIRRENADANVTAMIGKGLVQGTCLQIPDFHVPIVSARCQESSVAREGRGGHRISR